MPIPHMSPEFLPEDHPDLLENTDLPAKVIRVLRNACFTRLSDFDNMTDIDLLREPGMGLRDVRAVREARARQKLRDGDKPFD
ncbi:hypothetical protein [Sinorhizobium chiapasense]|uniref:RNA polymerase alpha subunit C-terminal domain-containing protein n=1 Tax=Sinorhizobium chiapasense TaxID=501572 RepID=A0ABZ2BH10_9HYPH